jgi:hypothetical protein
MENVDTIELPSLVDSTSRRDFSTSRRQASHVKLHCNSAHFTYRENSGKLFIESGAVPWVVYSFLKTLPKKQDVMSWSYDDAVTMFEIDAMDCLLRDYFTSCMYTVKLRPANKPYEERVARLQPTPYMDEEEDTSYVPTGSGEKY